ncbi:CmpA/NrtA family ABC transporter substrate-binding protein [Neptunomonas sp. XY-337]|uniref:CmpA/NrtA family ABC transporter substrate-binding protein n=1 Tax=Neptunomonas sp. XY-337 TaxID=2561897 RepID=UPI0010AB221D|nr:CmpA/NrtA family ABC transporter substrate-binding protein [Neptunomonas sp. XY-337]
MVTIDALEKTELQLGFVALADCAPLVVAREQGFFRQQGLQVVLSKESSWASLRDKVSYGLLDGAQMLAPLPLAATLGLNGKPQKMETPLVLSQNGIAITLSSALQRRLNMACEPGEDQHAQGKAFKAMLAELGYRPIIATVYPFSNHYYLLRFWLAQHQIEIGRDVELIAAPPGKMLSLLQRGDIDGYCVGEPWNSLAVQEGAGELLVSSYTLWGAHMEKVLGVTSEWARCHPNTYRAMTQAIYQACQWIGLPEHRDTLLNWLALPPYLDASPQQLRSVALLSTLEQRFSGREVNRPSLQHGEFLLQQMMRCQQLSALPADAQALVSSVYREDLFTLWCEPAVIDQRLRAAQ